MHGVLVDPHNFFHATTRQHWWHRLFSHTLSKIKKRKKERKEREKY